MLIRTLALVLVQLILTASLAAQDIRGYGVLQTGKTYRAASEYCHSETDLREMMELLKSSGFITAKKLWTKKVEAALCFQDPADKSTEFRVVRLVETYTHDGITIHVMEVVIGRSRAFALSPIPVITVTGKT